MNKPPSEAASTDILLRDLQMRQIELELQNENLRQTKAALAASEARWKFAIEGAGDGLWDWSIQTGKAFYSTRYKTMPGFAEDEIGDTADEWVKRIHPDDAPEVFSTMRPSGATAVEFRMQRKDGSWQWTSGRGMVVERDAQGMPLRMIGTNSDISERKHAEAQLQRATTRAGQSHARRGASPWRHLSQRRGTIKPMCCGAADRRWVRLRFHAGQQPWSRPWHHGRARVGHWCAPAHQQSARINNCRD